MKKSFEAKEFFSIRLRACTSIVAQNTGDQIWHGRNLDYDFEKILRNLTIIVDFKKNNEVKFDEKQK